MSSTLIIEVPSEAGMDEVARLTGGTVTLGREPENEIVIDSTAVSRRHACLAEAGSQWVFRDFGSTNGSWVNGVKVVPPQTRLLRTGDVLQLADSELRIRLEQGPGYGDLMSEVGTTLLIFLGEKFQSEFPMMGEGSRFSVGGPEGYIYIDGNFSSDKDLEICLGRGRLELSVGSSQVPILVNGLAISGVTSLSDRDEIGVGPYRIVVNEQPIAQPRQSPIQFAHPTSSAPSHASSLNDAFSKEWETVGRPRQGTSRKFIFTGTTPEDEPDPMGTMSMPASEMGSRVEMSISQRFAAVPIGDDDQPSREFSKIMFILGIVLIFAVVSLLLFFVLKLAF